MQKEVKFRYQKFLEENPEMQRVTEPGTFLSATCLRYLLPVQFHIYYSHLQRTYDIFIHFPVPKHPKSCYNKILGNIQKYMN